MFTQVSAHHGKSCWSTKRHLEGVVPPYS